MGFHGDIMGYITNHVKVLVDPHKNHLGFDEAVDMAVLVKWHFQLRISAGIPHIWTNHMSQTRWQYDLHLLFVQIEFLPLMDPYT